MDLARIVLRTARENARRPAARAAAGGGGRRRGLLRDSPPVLLGQALRELIEKKAPWAAGVSPLLQAAWRDLSPDLARHITVSHFDAATGVLEVRADSKAWGTQVRLLAPHLLPRLNELLKPVGIGPVRQLTLVGYSGGKNLPPLPPPRQQVGGEGGQEPRRLPRVGVALRAMHTEAAGCGGDAVVEAARARQAQQAPHEPPGRPVASAGWRAPASTTPGSGTVRARALVRARQEVLREQAGIVST
ncbi:DciA family protein [Streptomyces spectabilis]|uniref:DUF721 domain-containing protein n=1 Tax=Streptomyces spectabilis TaxID=68270 RepID=A0A7W8B3V1_STRST|nr:DUF721 domain-containing protein [Streptomyces spectabilis]MBB5109206.1 hypothetical protein [Streptomyces spectabilis]MCI3907761.1 DUF721 domain-containing protein [Streptomyces spectabilis]GGV51363.1 hypothetical protein GCM10010245_80970 [Streptomyces spectabilis]